ncbi:MAG: dTDP-4-dehydrorhamnose 3,5-epimerase [Pseudomonadota bacterium]
MKATFLDIPGLVEIVPTKHQDERGYFVEAFRQNWFAETAGDVTFVQVNQAMSVQPGTVRGLHAQVAPSEQGKLVQCLTGSVFDVAVDARRGSPSYGRWAAVTLTAEACNQVWIPPGFLHGYCSLTPNATVSYLVSGYYDREREVGVRWNDPAIGIEWPDLVDESTISAKDRTLPELRETPDLFPYTDGKDGS